MQAASESEKRFIQKGIKRDIRSDGRTRVDYRHMTLETGILSQANGSSRIVFTNANTDILVAVKAEIVSPEEATPHEGFLNISVECSSSVSHTLQGRAASDMNVELSQILTRMVVKSRVLDLKDLCILKGKYAWSIYVDIMVTDSGGNLLDAMALAAYAALKTTWLPQLTEATEDLLEVDSDPLNAVPLPPSIARAMPIVITAFVFDKAGWIVDATLEEEAVSDARLSVAVNREGVVCGIQKAGNGGVRLENMQIMLENCAQIGKTLFHTADGCIAEERSKNEEALKSITSIDQLAFLKGHASQVFSF